MRAVILAAALVLMSSGAWAGHAFETGESLLNECRQSDGAHCIAYIFGVVDTMAVNVHDPSVKIDPKRRDIPIARYSHSYWACPPERVTGGQLRDIVVRFLQDNPGEWRRTAARLVARALSEAFPCPEG